MQRSDARQRQATPSEAATLTEAEWEALACVCNDQALCHIHHEDADSYVEFLSVDLYARAMKFKAEAVQAERERLRCDCCRGVCACGGKRIVREEGR